MKIKLMLSSVIFVLLIAGVSVSRTVNAQFDFETEEEGEDSYDTRDNEGMGEKVARYEKKPSGRKEKKSRKDEEISDEEAVDDLPPFQVPYDPDIPTKRILVTSFENGVPTLSSQLNIEVGLAAQLITALSKSKNFIVVDRSSLAVLKDELTLAQAGAVNKKTAVAPGKLLGAQVMIKGIVTEFSEEAKGSASGFKIGLGSIAGAVGAFSSNEGYDVLEAINPEIGKGKETVTGTVGLDIRLIDIETGKVLQSIVARGKLKKQKSNRLLGIAGISTMSEGFENSVIGQATRIAIQDAVLQIAEGMKKIPWKGAVAAVKPDGIVIINAGTEKNIRLGQLMYVESELDSVIDPETGLVLYSDTEKIGVIRIISVKQSISFAEILSGENIKRGDIVTMKYD